MNLISNNHFTDLAEKYGTPLYVYNLQTIIERIDSLKKNLDVSPVTEFLYAVKANYNPVILKHIITQDFGIDAVSLEEAKLGLHCGAPREKIMLTENNITDTEMLEAHTLGILINIGSLSRLKKFGKNFPNEKICVRLNPEIGGAGSHQTNITSDPQSKFGIPINRADAIREIVNKYNLKIIGLHYHVGSGWMAPEEPLKALNVFLQTTKQFPDLEFLDLGGGFGVPYREDEAPLDLKKLGELFRAELEKFFNLYGKILTIRFEPGRYVVAESGHLLTRVNTKKIVNGDKIIIGTDTGMNQLVRVAMYDAYHPIANISNPEGKPKKYDIVGNVCESSDFFAKDRMIAEIREGDLLSINIAGAYGMSMASNYQFKPLPAEVLVGNGTEMVIRNRQTFEDLIKKFADSVGKY